MTEIDLTPCPDCGASPRLTRCDCDFAGLRVQKCIAALEADKRRLDWLERNYLLHSMIFRNVEAAFNCRAAIDAAMDSAGKEPQ